MREIAETACTEITYAQGTVIFTEGDSANALFILDRGEVDLQIGGEKTVYSLTGKGRHSSFAQQKNLPERREKSDKDLTNYY